MARILIFANDESTIYNFRREILEALVAQGFQAAVCYPLGPHANEIEEIGCELFPIGISRHGKNMIQEIRLIKVCGKIIKSYKPDVVLTYTVKPNIYASIACELAGVPYINNITGLGSVLQNPTNLSKIVLILQKLAYWKSSCVFFQNKDNYEKLKKYKVVTEKTPTRILPGSGVNTKTQAYETFPEDDGVIRFIVVARIRTDKGYREFFEASERIKEKYQNTEFHIVGWYEENELKDRLHELKDKKVIIYHGSQAQEEVHRLIARCNCLVHPSYHEGMANVLLEAAATGRPVIATRIPGCEEAFEEGITGYGCESKNVESLFAAMEKMVLTPYMTQEKMGQLGRKKMEREFDRSFVVDSYIEEIRKVIEEK